MKLRQIDQSYEVSSTSSLFQSLQKYQADQCGFCQGVSIIRCMMISVSNKHNEEPNFYLGLTNKLVDKNPTLAYLKYQELLKDVDQSEKLLRFYDKKIAIAEKKDLLEYYKYRKFVPLFADIKLGRILHTYYYKRLKIYYNEIKKKLNLSVDQSSESQFTDSESSSVSRPYIKSKILNDLSDAFKIQEMTTTNIQTLKSESKALEDLLKMLKANEKFKNIRPLNVQMEWQKEKKTSKQMFRDTILGQKNNVKKQNTNSKSKIFITFYSRDTSLYKSQRNISTKNTKSQKLVKSKDINLIKHQRQVHKHQRQVHKHQRFDKIKDQLFNQKIKGIFKQKNQTQNIKTKQKNKKAQIQHEKFNHTKQISSVRESSSMKKLNNFSKKQQPLIIETKSIKVSPYQQEFVQLQNKRKKYSSQPKLKKLTPIISHTNTPKLSDKQLQKYVSNKQLVFQKQSRNQKIVTKYNQNDRPLSRRKSLDVLKMRISLPQQINKDNSGNNKEQFLTQRYKRFIENGQRKQARTVNVSPTHFIKQKNVQSPINLEKNDNIVTIKRKKLELLKKKLQIQKINKK